MPNIWETANSAAPTSFAGWQNLSQDRLGHPRKLREEWPIISPFDAGYAVQRAWRFADATAV